MPASSGSAQDGALDGNFVVARPDPRKRLADRIHHFLAIGLARGAQIGILSERDRLQRAGLGTVEDAGGAVDVAAAERDDSLRDTAKSIHRGVSLPVVSQDEIDDHVGCKVAKRRARCLDVGALAENVPNMTRRAGRQAGLGESAMVDGHFVSLCEEVLDDKRPDETAAADQDQPHVSTIPRRRRED